MASELASHLPPDLIELIIENIDTLQALSSSSLVCRLWLPFARNRLPVFLSPWRIPGFLELLESPQTTLFSTLRQLKIWASSDEQVHIRVLQTLPKFSRLRWLSLDCSFPVDMPALPQLTGLSLSGKFASYASFVRFMSDLPALQILALSQLLWDDTLDPQLTFPTLDLEVVSFNWGSQLPIEHIMFSLRARIGTGCGGTTCEDCPPPITKASPNICIIWVTTSSHCCSPASMRGNSISSHLSISDAAPACNDSALARQFTTNHTAAMKRLSPSTS
ncbi:hypothetical protein B0H19DRAFT_230699 [Mycena capillaripes]|nr:hypothetical protein B0H19DRAFT_230699 [Mycena capillaripes]